MSAVGSHDLGDKLLQLVMLVDQAEGKVGRALTVAEAKSFLEEHKHTLIKTIFSRFANTEVGEEVRQMRQEQQVLFRKLMADSLHATLPDVTWHTLYSRIQTNTSIPPWTMRGEDVPLTKEEAQAAGDSAHLQKILTALEAEEKRAGGPLDHKAATKFMKKYARDMSSLIYRTYRGTNAPPEGFNETVADIIRRVRLRVQGTDGRPITNSATIQTMVRQGQYTIAPDNDENESLPFLQTTGKRPQPAREELLADLKRVDAELEAEEKKAGGRLRAEDAKRFVDRNQNVLMKTANRLYWYKDVDGSAFRNLLMSRLYLPITESHTWSTISNRFRRSELAPAPTAQQDAMLQGILIGRLPPMGQGETMELPESPMHSGLPAPDFDEPPSFMDPDEPEPEAEPQPQSSAFPSIRYNLEPRRKKPPEEPLMGLLTGSGKGTKRSVPSSLEEARNYERKLQSDLKLLINAMGNNSSSSSPAQLLSAQVDLERQIADAQAAVAQEELFAEEPASKRRRTDRKADDNDEYDFLQP
jgi:hypothetical protein